MSEKNPPADKNRPEQQPGSLLLRLKAWPWKAMAAWAGKATCVSLGVLSVLYLWGMVFYNGPCRQAGVWNALLGLAWVGLVACLIRWETSWRRRLVGLVGVVLMVVLPYILIRPSNHRDWDPDFVRTGHSEVDGDVLTVYNLRNFDYARDGTVTERWETRAVRLSQLRGLDLFHDTFMGDVMAHPILSFDFGPDGRVCLSVETRRERGEEFTPFGGMYKVFELQYLFSTEEDCIRLRTNVRKEPVYLYEIDATLDEIRDMFLASVAIQNDLAERPRFYNVIHANCTTSLRTQRPEGKRGPWDRRLLFNGLLDEYLYERGRLKTYGLTFPELRKRSRINTAAGKAHDAPDFSRRIRAGRRQ